MTEIDRARLWDRPIVTEIAPATAFFVAEDYHQQYFRNNTFQPYCQILIQPKVAKFRKEYLDRLKPEAAEATMYM